ncbi:hypothetical protein Tco_1089178 [Tanacetum coccineum]
MLHQRMFESVSYKSHPEHVALYEALEASKERAQRDEFLAEKDNLQLLSPQPGKLRTPEKLLPAPPSKNSEDTNTAHLPNIKAKPNWLRPVPEEDRPTSPEPDWTGNMSSFINWFCKRIGKKKPSKADLEGPAFKVVQPFHENIISLQFQIEEYHLLVTDQVDLVNHKGHRVVPNISKPLPLEVPPGQVTIQTQYFFNMDLEYLVSGDKGRRSDLSISKLKVAQYLDFGLEELVPSLWIESEREYDISATYGISHWWFKRKEFYITRHSASSDRNADISHMRILSVVSLKTYERYGYTFLKEYKILKADFKNLHPNDFKDLYLLHCWELCIPNLVPLVILFSTASCN